VRALQLKVGSRAQIRGLAAIVIACLIVGAVAAPASSAAPARNRGYWIAGQNEQVFAFGDAVLYPQSDLRVVRGQIVDLAADPRGRGYWLLGQDGQVYPHGEARDFGRAFFSDQSAVAITATPTGAGYWIASDKGGVVALGDALDAGSLAKTDLKKKLADMAATPTGRGYWLVDENGGVYAFGDAAFLGSSDGKKIVGMAARPQGDGYWLVDDGGAVSAFGAATSFGSLNDPAKKIVDITPTHSGAGYWIVDRDGLVFAFGDAVRYGELAKKDLRSGQIVAIVSTPFVNHDPVARQDAVEIDEDTTIDIDVLANDSDEDGDAITAAVLTQPAHGTATLNASGTIHYAPARDFNGPDSFTYRVTDALGAGATGLVRISVRPVNDAPVAKDDAFTTDEDTPLTASLVTNDTDVDGDALTGVLVALPTHGGVVLGAAGAFTYTPAADFNGDDAFTYRASDGALTSDVATVRIHVNPVNDAPVAVADTGSLDEDTTLTAPPPGVLGNDTDVDGDALHVVLASGTSHGTLVLMPNGGYTYTPSANYNGSDAFSYRASDGALDSGTVTMTLTIRPVNDPPVAAADAYDATEDTALVVAARGLLANDSDVDGDTLRAELAVAPAHGSVTVQPDGGFSYTPAANFNGTDTFTYVARDAESASAATMVTIRVAAVNDAPEASADEYRMEEDATLVVAAPGVLGNDHDVDSPTITATLRATPSHGDLEFSSDGSFTYTPDPDFFGTDSFAYLATDGALASGDTTVVIFVSGVEDAPVALPDAYTTNEDTPLLVGAPGLLVNDSDADGDTLTVRVAEQPLHGDVDLLPDGTFTYTPDANYNGTDTFSYDLTDGQQVVFGTTVTITIIAVDDPPTANDDSYGTQVGATLTVSAPGVLANDVDDSGALTAILVTGPAHGTLTLSANGSFSYTTNLAAAGTDSFTYKVTDGTTESAPATVHLSITAGSGGGGTPGSFGGYAQPTLVVWDFDVLKIASGTGTLKTKHGQVIQRAGGTFYVPERGFRGHDSFDYGGRHYEIDVISDVWGD
jgi:VCBS repeat-containing protein